MARLVDYMFEWHEMNKLSYGFENYIIHVRDFDYNTSLRKTLIQELNSHFSLPYAHPYPNSILPW